MNWHEWHPDSTVSYSLYAAKETFSQIYKAKRTPEAYNNWLAMERLYLGLESIEPVWNAL